MGKVAEKETMQTEEELSNYEHQQKDEDGSTEVVFRWDKFLPRVALRVLLVEADDSTRQIIAALLRKCSYRVAAVSDGLKAWETLKIRASDIDLILTEVELPSISGFSLLTLIMEHDIYKNIPVIMMSSHDSVSMVFKCMLKGAADFLIKPVRRNELRNLWQHVWRRHAIGKSPQNLTFAQKKLEATSENNATSKNSTGSVASTQKNNECSEKTSEAQSTCTSPFLEAESASMENMQDTCQLKSSTNLSNIVAMKHEKSTKFEKESAKHNNESQDISITFASEATRCKKAFESTNFGLEQGYHCTETENHDEVLRAELNKATPNINAQIHGCCNGMLEPSGGAIDLIATFENLPKNSDKNCSFNGDRPAKFDFDMHLELSLRRDLPRSSCKQATGDSQTLNHSNASAFSLYSGSGLQLPLFPSPSNDSAKLSNTNWNSLESCKLSGTVDTVDSSHQYGSKNQNQENISTLVIGQSGQVEPKLPNTQLGLFPATMVTSDHKSGGHGNVFPSILCGQSGVHPIWTLKPFCQEESSPFPSSTSSQSSPKTNHSEQRHHWSDDVTYSSDQNVDDKSTLSCARHNSPAIGQSAGTSLSHEAVNHINSISTAHGSIGSRSDANGTSAVTVKNNPESSNDDGFRGTHHSSQREAALTKFRLKRKERCYEKKVRYQSRKRLAEQRPRLKGQFVRQVPNEHTVADASGGS